MGEYHRHTMHHRSLRPGALARRILPDGRELVVYKQMFNAALVVGKPGRAFYEDRW
jgi:hypothetical protein